MRRATLLLLFALLAAGCNQRDERLVRVSLIGDPDPAVTPGAGKPPQPPEIRAATVEGLVGFDEQGRVVPALADRWIVTEDGQSYIFRLRNGAWPDGKPITGESAAAALRQVLRALRGTPLALDLAPIDEIRSMAGRVVEIRLSSPLPDLLTLLAQPELGLARKGRGTSPMTLDHQGRVQQLEPVPPEKLGLPAQEDWLERVRVVRVRIEPADKAVERFDEGYADVVLGGRADTWPFATTAGISRGTVRLDPVIGLFGLLVADDEGFLGDPLNREALAMAIDREALLAPFNVAGWAPTTRIVSPDLEGGPGPLGERWAAFTLAERQQIAAERVARWRKTVDQTAPIRIALPDSVGGTLIYERLRADLERIGLATERVAEQGKADLLLLDRVARYGRASWFLNQLSCAAKVPVCSREADDLVAAARATPDPQRRADLLAEAESLVAAANGFIPFARPLRWSLVRADVTGFATNPWGAHPLLRLALQPG